MAQFGRNYYGSSVYGYNGVFAGEFEGDMAELFYPIKSDNSKLSFEYKVRIPKVTYLSTDDIFRYTGAWTIVSTSKQTTAIGNKAYISVVCSDFTINYTAPISTGFSLKMWKIDTLDPVDVISTTPDYTATLNGAGGSSNFSYTIPDAVSGAYYGEILIELTSTGSVSVTSPVKVNNISATTGHILTDAMVEINAVPMPWQFVQIKRMSYTSDIAIYKGEILNVKGLDKYKFRTIILTSDSTTSPEVLSLDVSVGGGDKYVPEGFYKIILDLLSFRPNNAVPIGDDSILDIVSIDYNGNYSNPDDSRNRITNIDLRSRVTDFNIGNSDFDYAISWGVWSPPYRKSQQRIMLNTKKYPTLTSGYFMSEIMKPTDLYDWLNMTLDYWIPYKNITVNPSEIPNTSVNPTVFFKTNKNTSMTIEFYNSQNKLLLLNNNSNSKDKTKTDLKNSSLQKPIGTINTQNGYRFEDDLIKTKLLEGLLNIQDCEDGLRVKVIFDRLNNLTTTPYIEYIRMNAKSLYKESRYFGYGNDVNGQPKIESYGSSVYNDNGISYIYTNGKTRTNKASITNLAFTYPTAQWDYASVPVIDIPHSIENIVYESGVNGSNMMIYWETKQGSKEDSDVTTNNTDVLKVKVTSDNKNIPIHNQVRSGVVMKIDNPEKSKFQSDIMSNIFVPNLSTDKQYAYYLKDLNKNEYGNVDIRWNYENQITPLNRRSISHIKFDQINISISSPREGNLVPWTSEEKIIGPEILNKLSPIYKVPKVLVIKDPNDIPYIPADAIIDSQPYKVSVVPGSVLSDGDIKDDNRVAIDIQSVSYVDATEELLPLYRIDTDNEEKLPRARVKNVYIYDTDVNGKPATTWSWKSGTHFDIIKDTYTDSQGNTLEHPWGSKIRWRTGINPAMPLKTTKLYVTLTYEKPSELKISAECDYNENEYSIANIWRSSVKKIEGVCTPTSDYNSDTIDIGAEWVIPSTVDRNSVNLRAIATKNNMVRVHVENNKVIGTLDRTDPRDNWHPYINKGFYYSGKKEGYLYTSQTDIILSEEHIPISNDVEYVANLSDANDKGILLQASTQNVLSNTKFVDVEYEIITDPETGATLLDTNSPKVELVFSDSFER